MRTLQSTPNIGAVTTAFPDGSIVDQAGSIVGTSLTEILYGDTIQAIHKLKRLAAITENNLPDNETNGFQILTALFANSLPIWQSNTANVDFSKTKFVSYSNGIYYHKTTVSTTNNPSVDTTNWAVICYWNGTKIVLADESRIAAIESNISNKFVESAVSLSPYESGYVIGQYDYLSLNRNNKVVTLYFRLTCNNPTGFAVATIPEGYRPPHSVSPIPYGHSTGSYEAAINTNGIFGFEILHSSGTVTGFATWVIA